MRANAKMNLITTIILGLSMSSDAFIVALCRGSIMCSTKFRDALRIAIIFAIIEMLAPLIGWFACRNSRLSNPSIGHWVALFLLTGLGFQMILSSWRRDSTNLCKKNNVQPFTSNSLAKLTLTGMTTSIDALALGATVALLNTSIYTLSLVIGTCTLIGVTVGVMLSHRFQPSSARLIELSCGLVLIFIGITTVL